MHVSEETEKPVPAMNLPAIDQAGSGSHEPPGSLCESSRRLLFHGVSGIFQAPVVHTETAAQASSPSLHAMADLPGGEESQIMCLHSPPILLYSILFQIFAKFDFFRSLTMSAEMDQTVWLDILSDVEAAARFSQNIHLDETQS